VAASDPAPSGRPPTAFILHPASALHDTGWGHPEHQGRLPAVVRAVERDLPALAGRVEELAPGEAETEDILRVHSEAHLAAVRSAVENAARTGRVTSIDADTRVSERSWEAAFGAVGAVIEALRSVAEASHRNGFVATRPPGHHATSDRAMGFCLFNNVACGARWLQAHGWADRVLIVDWDVHHGNGTQDVFWEDSSVFFLSIHQAPHYPGTGRESDRGAGPGEGFTHNVELPAGTSAEAYLDAFEAALDVALGAMEPDFVLVSSGFDCLAGDPLGGLLLEPHHIHAMTRTLLRRTEPSTAGRIVACLEGGYDPARTGQGALALIRALAGLEPPETTGGR
jgi:acetoin utilization deacetylase AcuC-like enzyme